MMAIPSLVAMTCLIEKKGLECWWSAVGEIFFAGKKKRRAATGAVEMSNLTWVSEVKTYKECQEANSFDFPCPSYDIRVFVSTQNITTTNRQRVSKVRQKSP
jgi:hypothetical protein